MNRLTVKQRKGVYVIVAAMMFVATIILGAPATRDGSGKLRLDSWLAQSRDRHDLGETSLGDVDPTSAAMTLVLFGMRGVAASWLWYQADQYKDKKNFSQLKQNVESIVLLQPHYKAVWIHQAWNLSYNVSAECDAVEDRFFWLKSGAKFLDRGIKRNRLVAELPFEMGRFLGQKIGLADEREEYREFFVHDPDVERWKGGPDEDLNRDGEDNNLVARKWYFKANEVLSHPGVEQHTTDYSLFIAYPYRSLMDYARAIQKDGVKADLSAMTPEQREAAYQDWARNVRKTWDSAYDEWTNIYGRQKIPTSHGGFIVLENDPEGMKELIAIAEQEGMKKSYKMDYQERYRKITGYPYWKKHCDIERRDAMTQARYHFAEGRRLFRDEQDFEGAKEHFEKGMAHAG